MIAADRISFESRFVVPAILALALSASVSHSSAASDNALAKTAEPSGKISYYRDIRPILQANCQGCHQPAKAKGGYVMTSFKGLLGGGETEGAAVVPEHPGPRSIF